MRLMLGFVFLLLLNTSIRLVAQTGKKRDVSIRTISSESYKKYNLLYRNKTLTPLAIKKSNGQIRLKLSNGKYVTLKDNTGVETEETVYTLKGLLLNRFYVVLVNHYETGEYLLINKQDGKTVMLWGMPFTSPESSYVASYSASLDYDMMPNGIQVYDISRNTISLAWEYKIDNWQPKSIIWKNTNTLLVQKEVPAHYSSTKKKIISYLEIGLR